MPLWSFGPIRIAVLALLAGSLLLALPRLASAQSVELAIHDDPASYPGLTNVIVRLTGRAELRLAGAGNPMPGCIVHLDSTDSRLWLPQVPASQATSTLLSRVRVHGNAAVSDLTVRVAQAGRGCLILPHATGHPALEVFSGRQFTGNSRFLEPHVAHQPPAGPLGSFKLKRGYLATFASQDNGGGASRCFVAQDGDLELGRLPAALENNVRFIRILPWRWTGKKGVAGDIESGLAVDWTYNWNLNRNSPADWEYVPIRQTRYWPPLDQDWKARGASHLLGYNEPDRPDQANLTVAEALAGWPDLLATGLRLGAPAVSDGGLAWLYDFIGQADAAGLRVDFVPVHYYRCFGNAADPAGAANQFYNFLKGIHDVVQRPLWITEWNNGANWTSCADPTFAQQQATIAAILDMLDRTPFVERYAIYNWVEDVRRVKWDDGSLTLAGEVYRDQVAPAGYRQELPDTGIGTSARYSFDGHALDATDSAHAALLVGSPRFTTGRHGQAIALNGSTDYLQIAPRVADNTDWTFAGWVYWNGGANWQRIFDFGQDTSHYLFLTPRSSGGQLRFAINDGNGEQQLSAPALTAGQWTHLAVTLSGSVGKLFVNGVVVATTNAMTINPVDIGTRFNYLGKSQFATDPLFSGRFDDFRFLSSALTDAQIAALASTAPPRFASVPLSLPDAAAGVPYAVSLASMATGTAPLTFAKVAGPDWVSVSADGQLTGTPTDGLGGPQDCLVRVTDPAGSMDVAVLRFAIPSSTTAIASGADDAEQAASGAVNLTSTDLELVQDSEGGAGDQLIGLRFTGLPIPAGAIVTNAVIQFVADESQSEETSLEIQLEAADHAAPFAATANQLGARTRVPWSVPWSPAPWIAGGSNALQRTPNLASLVQEVVSRPGWSSGQAMVFLVTGSGHRTAESADKSGGQPARLSLGWIPPTPRVEFTASVTGGPNDAEQSAAGTMSLTSTDLELVEDDATASGAQLVGLRFESLPIPAGATLESARLQFTADEAQSDPTSLLIRAQATDHAPLFTATANNLGGRTWTTAAVPWQPPAWTVPGEKASLQSSPDLTEPLREVLNRPGWASGRAIALLLTGSGHRTADAADKAGGSPAELRLTWRPELPRGSYARWQQTRTIPPKLPNGPGAPEEDPDGDGYANLFEYALDLDPGQPESGALELRPEGLNLIVTFTRSSLAPDVTSRIEWRDTLGAGPWNTVGVVTRVVRDDGARRTFQATLPAGAAGQRFVRLQLAPR